MTSGRRLALGLALAIGLGLAIGYADSRPRFDATGITVVLLVLTAATCSFVVGAGHRRSAVLAAVLASALVGMWVPIFELQGGAGVASLASLVFAAIGGVIGFGAARMVGAIDQPS
jgi:hypothetical protein